jgi:hypothetical protein
VRPDPSIGPTTDCGPSSMTPIADKDLRLTYICNHRKAVGYKTELLVEYNNGARDFALVNSCFSLWPADTQAFLEKHNWIISQSKNPWRKLGFKTDPSLKKNRITHDYDEFSDLPWVLQKIKDYKTK